MKTLTQLRLWPMGVARLFAMGLVMIACAEPNGLIVPMIASSPQDGNASSRAAWGPESPNFNLEATLQGEGSGFGLVKFRQPNDDKLIVELGVWVRDLEPDASYVLQRAVDTNLDGTCTSTSWLTLGIGLDPQTIDTDSKGTGTAQLWRSLAAFPVGATFEIHFRILNAATMVEVLSSDCYQFTISQ